MRVEGVAISAIGAEKAVATATAHSREILARAAFVAGPPSGGQLAEIAKIIDSGKLAPIIDRILPLSEARRAQELSQSGHTHGKIALRITLR